MKERILKTLESYLLINEDVLSEEHIEDLKEQIEFVKKSMIEKEIYPVYQENHDLTFVMVDIIDKEKNEPVSLECIGFHFGEPFEKEYYKKNYSENPKEKAQQLKAIFQL